MMKKILLGTLMLTASMMAKSSSACDNPNLNDFDRNYCLNKVYYEADNELNAKYKQLKVMLNKDGQRRLINGEKRWIQEKDYNCQDGGTTYIQCKVDYTIERINFLQDRIRECKSSGCLNSKL